MLISRFLRVCGFVVFRHLPTLDFVSPFSIRMFALLENVRFMVVSC